MVQIYGGRANLTRNLSTFKRITPACQYFTHSSEETILLWENHSYGVPVALLDITISHDVAGEFLGHIIAELNCRANQRVPQLGS